MMVETAEKVSKQAGRQTTRQPAFATRDEAWAYQHQLCVANGFTWEEVEENRAGRLSPRQAALKGKKESRARGVLGGAVTIILGAGLAAMSLANGEPLYALLGLGLAGYGLYRVAKWYGMSDELLDSFEGTLRKKSETKDVNTGNAGLLADIAVKAVAGAAGYKNYFYACDGGPDIAVSRAGHDALREDVRHRVYYTPTSKTLLSVEVLFD